MAELVGENPKLVDELLHKLEKYYKEQYKIPPPPVPTAQWSVYDWVRYIDKEGMWLDD